jgi:hypothetical protein
MPKHGIPWIIKEPPVRIDRKALAGWTADQALKFTTSKSQALTDSGRILILYPASSNKSAWVIELECGNCTRIKVVCVQAIKSDLPESFFDPTSPAEKIDSPHELGSGSLG